jgi:hypothetical protein
MPPLTIPCRYRGLPSESEVCWSCREWLERAHPRAEKLKFHTSLLLANRGESE